MGKILLTGGAGYIGAHIAVSLFENGYTPVLVDNFSNSEWSAFEGIQKLCHAPITLHEVDCRDKQAMLEVIKQEGEIDGVIHLAAFKAVGESVFNPLKYYDNNLRAMNTLLEVMVDCGLNNLVFSSSCTVYGRQEKPEVKESDLNGEALSPYGQTKQISERMMRDVAAAGHISQQVCLRYFNPVGAHPSGFIGELPIGKPNNLVPYMAQVAAGKQGALTVFGNDYPTPDGTCIRDYIHVCDVAEAHVEALKWMQNKDDAILEVFNVGTGSGTSVNEIIRIFTEVNEVEIPVKIGARRAGDVSEIYANTDKIGETLKWKPRYSVGDALKHAWKWQQNLG